MSLIPNKETFEDVTSLFCEYDTRRQKIKCAIKHKVPTLEGSIARTIQRENISYVVVFDDVLALTELVLSPESSQATRITFNDPQKCELGMETTNYKYLRCGL